MSLLQEADDPVSRNWLLERVKETGHTMSRAPLNRALQVCLELGLASEGSKGFNVHPQPAQASCCRSPRESALGGRHALPTRGYHRP